MIFLLITYNFYFIDIILTIYYFKQAFDKTYFPFSGSFIGAREKKKLKLL